MNYQINHQHYKVIIEKKNNKNTYIRITDNEEIYVTTNYFTSKNKIIKLLDDNQSKIEKMINSKKKQQQKKQQFWYLGKTYEINYTPTKKVTITENQINVETPRKLELWLKKQTKQLFQERLEICYQKFQEPIPYPILKIRNMKSRWGVCNKKNNSVTLNSNLMQYDISQIDYVIIHELSHFVHFNHSKSFWNTVEKYDPNYKQNRKALKE